MGEVRENLKKNLNYYLNMMNVSQKTLAEKLNVSQAAVTNWVKGKNSPDIETVSEICKILNIKISDLLIEKNIQIKDILDLDDEQLLSKYHYLDNHGKRIIAYILNEEYERCISIEKAETLINEYSKLPDNQKKAVLEFMRDTISKEEARKSELEQKNIKLVMKAARDGAPPGLVEVTDEEEEIINNLPDMDPDYFNTP